MDPSTRPKPGNMKLWVDAVRFIKGGATEGRGALGFFTYMELSKYRFVQQDIGVFGLLIFAIFAQ